MSKYEPKTLPVQREGVTKFFAATKLGGAQWWTDEVSAAVVADLAHCESCLAEAEREIAALRETCDILWDHPEWIPMLKARKAMTGEEKTYSTEEVRQLLNSEGRLSEC